MKLGKLCILAFLLAAVLLLFAETAHPLPEPPPCRFRPTERQALPPRLIPTAMSSALPTCLP